MNHLHLSLEQFDKYALQILFISQACSSVAVFIGFFSTLEAALRFNEFLSVSAFIV
jgi:hypothetical protein